MGWGEAAGLVGACCWGVTSLLVRRSAGQADLGPLNAVLLALSALMGGVALLALNALGIHQMALGPQPGLALALVFASVLLNFAIGNSAYFVALRRLGVARAMPVTLLQPLLAALLAATLLGERLTVGLGLGVLLIPAGVYLVAVPRGGLRGRLGGDRLGLALALGAPLAWALGAVALRPALAWLDPLTTTVLRVSLGTPLLCALSLAVGRGRMKWPGPRLLLIGGLPFAGSTFLFTVAVSAAGAARATALSSTAPLFALPLAALWLGEPVTRRSLAGTLLAVAGVALVVSA